MELWCFCCKRSVGRAWVVVDVAVDVTKAVEVPLVVDVKSFGNTLSAFPGSSCDCRGSNFIRSS